MEILIQEWFWIGIFSILSVITGSLLTIIVEKSKRKTQIKIERLKMFDEKKFQAYLELYEFICKAYFFYYPTDNAEDDFIHLMKRHFFTKVKINYPYLKNDIREKIKILENQYYCLGERDFIPQIPFKEFYRSEYVKILNELNQTVEKTFDEWGKV